MNRLLKRAIIFIGFFFLLTPTVFADVKRIYDEADLLGAEQIQHLEEQAASYFSEWSTDFIIVTTNDTEGKSLMSYTQDVSDDLAEELNRAEDNMVILTIYIESSEDREAYIAAFGKGKEYVDNARVQLILDHIIPPLSDDDYFGAFELFFEKSAEYLNIRPGVNPESLLLNTYVQLAVAIGLGGIIVFFMAYSSGGRSTVTSGTYLNRNNSQIVRKHDRYLRKTVTRKRKPSNNNRGGGSGFSGGGGGVTRAGRSHSGGGRKF
ncbi:TPM domain-containing protein [Oceanobacillus alkalisoli]|uniref:TPM domain-containing protein n=1 Tax=Oceanobacillus alkalisoli TaxID=2925113 RepID=UPI001EF0B7C1|nr:TPM domain-containing protein [Oceanobacillus alkalisoli]MCF3944966.1 TPM domain-containing protein [Oceanobacillus alkalisoli]MCG5105246.1 TPM domain-containing protein [Oceanobacillus alkalisoli]